MRPFRDRKSNHDCNGGSERADFEFIHGRFYRSPILNVPKAILFSMPNRIKSSVAMNKQQNKRPDCPIGRDMRSFTKLQRVFFLLVRRKREWKTNEMVLVGQ